jgi:nicotinic acid mononucleotide adenylyltransferase
MGKMKKYRQLIKELPSKKVVFAFGRFQPPTTGHELLVKAVQKIASAQGADHVIYASKTEDKKQNPLPVSRKVYYLQRMFAGANFKAANEQERTFIEAAKALNKRYKNIVMVAGSDRIAEYKKILEKYNGTEFKFDTVSVVSAGERDPDSDNASGMSGTKMREAAKAGKFNEFKKGIPHSLTVLDARRLMNEIRKAYDLEPVKESLNIAVDDLRERYFRGEIFNVGDVVVSENKQCVVVKRGSNHLLLSEEGTDVKFTRWIKDVSLPAEQVQEELTNKTLKSNSTDQIKAARIIATTLGVENVESSANPAQIVNLGLRKIKSKALNAESYEILKRMLKMATDVGIKFDTNLMPQKLKEAYYDKLLSYDAEGRMTEIDTDKDGIPDWLERNMTKIGSSLHNDENDQLRKQKINYHLGEADTGNLTRQVAKSALAAKHAKEKEALSTKHASEKESLKEYEIDHDGKGNYRDDEGNEFRGAPRGSFARRHTITSTPSEPHSVHINGKKWKTYGSQSHAQNVANKIKGATVHKEEYEHILDALDEALASTDKGEYDYEGAMARTQLQTVCRNAQELIDMLGMDDNLPEWVQSKITLAQDYISSVTDYLKSRDELGEAVNPAQQAAIAIAMKKAGKKPKYKGMNELSTATLASYKQKAGADASAADKAGDYEKGNKRFKGIIKATNKQFDNDMKKEDVKLVEEHIVHVNDGSKYGEQPHDKDAEHVMAGVKKHGGEFDGHSDKGAFFKFKSHEDAKNFKRHVDSCPHKTCDADLHEGYLQSADQKIGKDGKKHAARLIKVGSDAPTNTRHKGYDAFSMEEVELSEEDIDVIVDEFQTWEDVIDAYEDDELAIIDEETGEEIDTVVSESEGVLNEVLSRIERIRAATRFARTKSKRMIKTKMALKRSSPQSVINTRARKLAIQTIKLRLAKKPLNTLSVAEKERLEQRIAKMKPILNRIAMKLAPRVRQIEKQRLSHSTYTK